LLEQADQPEWVAGLLEPAQPQLVQRQAIQVVDLSRSAELDQALLHAFSSLTPTLQDQALRVLIKRRDSIAALLDAVEAGQVKPSQIAPDLRQQILASKDDALVTRAKELLGQASADRLTVIDDYAGFYQEWQAEIAEPSRLRAARKSGAQSFQRVCGQCHRVSGLGHDVGAALNQLADKSPQQLIEAILDPNREVDPRYAGYTLLLLDGRVITGVIQEETANQITLATAGGEQLRVNRGDIDEMKSTGVSLMPTGLEEQLTPLQLAEILVFLQNQPSR
jgi:putative heme-binding domain-containing protein